jgi:methionine-rich copper-binding protein CopC
MKRLVLALTFGLLLGNTAQAADLTISDTSPKAGTSLSVGPNVVSITASAPLSDQGNIIVVNDPNGTAVDDGSVAVNGSTVIVGMKPLTVTGVYTVNYTLVSEGAPELTGNYTFMFTSPGAIASPSAQPSTTSSNKVDNANNATSNAVVYFLLFLAALVAIFLVWYARVSFGGKPRKRNPAKKANKKS